MVQPCSAAHVLILLYMSPHTDVCVLILLYMCPDTAISGRATRTRGAATAANASLVFAASALQAHRSEREIERERPFM